MDREGKIIIGITWTLTGVVCMLFYTEHIDKHLYTAIGVLFGVGTVLLYQGIRGK
jgi:hypothetical protein